MLLWNVVMGDCLDFGRKRHELSLGSLKAQVQFLACSNVLQKLIVKNSFATIFNLFSLFVATLILEKRTNPLRATIWKFNADAFPSESQNVLTRNVYLTFLPWNSVITSSSSRSWLNHVCFHVYCSTNSSISSHQH